MTWLLRALAALPLWLLHACGALLGWLGYLLSPAYRRRLAENAELAGYGPAVRRRSVAEAGKLVAELPRLWLRAPAAPLRDAVQWHGRQHLERWLADRRGLVLLTPHLGCFEVAAQSFAEVYGQRHPLTVLYRPARKAWLREWEERARARPYLATAPATLAGVRQMLRALRRGEVVGLLPDQVPPDGMGVWAPWFGRPAYTMTLAARLVRQTGAALGVLYAERLARGRGYAVHVLPAAAELPETGGDDAADAAAVNRAMERVVRLAPAQYLWGYHRYKSPRAAG